MSNKIISLSLPAPHPAQKKLICEAKRFNVLCCGRRWGKTVLGMDRLIHSALQRKPVAWFSPSNKLMSDTWRVLRSTLAPITREQIGTLTPTLSLSALSEGEGDVSIPSPPPGARHRVRGAQDVEHGLSQRTPGNPRGFCSICQSEVRTQGLKPSSFLTLTARLNSLRKSQKRSF